jgi:inner membrane transporter RhtA
VLPFGVAAGGADLLSPRLLLVGAAVALLSSVVPWSLEMQALRRIPPRVFGLLMSLEPAAAALIGFAVLGEVLGVREWVALVLVVAACVGVTRSRRPAS